MLLFFVSSAYFEQFGNIHHYNFTSPDGTGGFVFITYENSADVDRCLANRPHRIDGRHLSVIQLNIRIEFIRGI